MRTLSKLKISHPLAHCEAAKAYYYAWVNEANQYQPGHSIREAANEQYKHHLSTCEICIEVLEGLHGKSKEVFQVREGVTT
jgi:hypothetical protein